MLKNSFQHIPGIGKQTEESIWDSGCCKWEDFPDLCTKKFSTGKKEKIETFIKESQAYLANNDPIYFSRMLPSNLHWRMFPHFRDQIAYVDIETTGLEAYDEITTIAIYDGKEIHWYVNGENLDDFARDIFKYKLIVTYNGKTFDAPFIERFFGIQLNHAHIDLRYILKSLGYSGGLKMCEKRLGISRNDLDGIDGLFAVRLWDEYSRNNNKRALETLIAYNIEDVVNLEKLMIISYNKKIEKTPFNTSHLIDPPTHVKNPFSPDMVTIEKIINKYSFGDY